MVLVLFPVLSSSSATPPPDSGPAHTWSGMESSTAGVGVGGGGALLGLVARHHGVLVGKSDSVGSRPRMQKTRGSVNTMQYNTRFVCTIVRALFEMS